MSRMVHLGLDVGGTASRWVACDGTGAVLARGEAPGATGHLFNPAEKQRLARSLGEIAEALRAAGLRAASLTAGITGFGAAARDEGRALAGEVLGLNAGDCTLMDDIVLGYAAHFAPGEGHLISAGTGSIGLHVRTDGSLVRVGGRGILIDDAGSGSWIALEALNRIYRALDHDGSFASVEVLAQNLHRQVGAAGWSDVRQFVYAGDRGRIGQLAMGVAEAAAAGDSVALEILRQAGAELAGLAEALLSRCGEAPVRLAGGVARLHPVILEEMMTRLAGRDVRPANADAALAAARLGSGGGDDWAALLQGGLSIA